MLCYVILSCTMSCYVVLCHIVSFDVVSSYGSYLIHIAFLYIIGLFFTPLVVSMLCHADIDYPTCHTISYIYLIL